MLGLYISHYCNMVILVITIMRKYWPSLNFRYIGQYSHCNVMIWQYLQTYTDIDLMNMTITVMTFYLSLFTVVWSKYCSLFSANINISNWTVGLHIGCGLACAMFVTLFVFLVFNKVLCGCLNLREKSPKNSGIA